VCGRENMVELEDVVIFLHRFFLFFLCVTQKVIDKYMVGNYYTNEVLVIMLWQQQSYQFILFGS
jgi:hypothetical protein